MSEKTTIRASGLTAGEEQSQVEGNLAERDIEEDIPVNDESSERHFMSPGFQRMKIDWEPQQRAAIDFYLKQMEEWMDGSLASAYDLLDEIYMVIRVPVIDDDGPVLDENGRQVWAKTLTGHVAEDFSKLTIAQRNDFADRLAMGAIHWENYAGNIWFEAMFARVTWEEMYAINYDKPRNKTMGERDAIAKKEAIRERYFAIFMAAYSRKVDGLLRRIQGLISRLEKS